MRAKAIMNERTTFTTVEAVDFGPLQMFDGLRDTLFLNGDRHMAGRSRGFVVLLVGMSGQGHGVYRAFSAKAARQLAKGLMEMADQVEAEAPTGTVLQ